MTIAGEKYDVLLVVEHGLYPPNLDVKQDWYDQMCMTMKSSYSCLSYNTNNGADTPCWSQYGSTSVTITADMKSRMASKGADPSKLGR